MNILVTGGAGFIGSNFLNMFVPRHPEHNFINLDKLTYAANPLNLAQIEASPNYSFEQADITDYDTVNRFFEQYKPALVVHFAAESHVDRSILGPAAFIETNITGTFNLLEACRKLWQNTSTPSHPKGQDQAIPSSPAEERRVEGDILAKRDFSNLFLHVSTDEVYGSLGPEGLFTEKTAYDPSSPYSASKASSDHLVRAYHRTYGLPAIITNCSNNYGPYQFPEKLIPLMILNALEEKPLPVYGKGENVRDWLFVEDHCRAIWAVIEKGTPGETYNIGGNSELKNLDLIHLLCENLAEENNKRPDHYKKLVKFVPDRPGHDLRYAIDASKIKNELEWVPEESFETGLSKTVKWYLSNPEWVENIKTGAYRTWLEQNYSKR